MKKINLLVMMAMLAMTGMTFSACGDDDEKTDQKETTSTAADSDEDNNGEDGDGEGDGGNGNGDGQGGNGTSLTPAEQKAKLETVALELMDIMKADDFKSYADLGNYIDTAYVKKYDWDGVGQWAKDCFEAARQFVGETKESSTSGPYGPYNDYYSGSYYTYAYVYNYITKNYVALLEASNFCSHFRAVNGKWIREDASDLQFIFNDQNGKECVLKLTTSGTVKKVHLGTFKESVRREYDTYYGEDNYVEYVTNRYYDYTDATIGVPEKIVLTLTQGVTTLVNTTVNIDLKDFTGEEFYLDRNSLSLTASVEMSNGYKIRLTNVAYNANQKALADMALTKGSTTLISCSLNGDVSGVPSVNVSELVDEKTDANGQNLNAKSVLMTVNVLDKLKVQGTIQDAKKFADYLEKADDNDDNESTFKSYISSANSMMSLNVYYDNQPDVQATVKLEPFAKKKWTYYGERTYWTSEPVLMFFDGSSYQTLSVFFDEDDFSKTVSTFENLLKQYRDLIR